MGWDRPDMKFSVTRFEDREMLARTRYGVMLRTGRMDGGTKVRTAGCGVVLGTGRVVVGERTNKPSLLGSRTQREPGRQGEASEGLAYRNIPPPWV